MRAFLSHLLAIIPTIVIVFYMVGGAVQDFRMKTMRPLSLFLLLVMAPTLYLLKREDRASVIEKAMFGYIFLAAAAFWVWPEGLGGVLVTHPVASLYLVFFTAVAAPPILGREPFTAYFARRRTSPEVWETDVFKRINLHMAWTWAGIFAACGLAALIPSIFLASETLLTRIMFQMAIPGLFLLGVGLPLNKFYPDFYQRKLGLEPVSSHRPVLGLPQDSAEPLKPSAMKEEAMPNKRRIVAVNGSPHAGMGNTAMILEMLRGPLAEEGLSLEVIELAEKRIDYCVGCATCLEKGRCWRQDDHARLAAQVLEAAGVVLASPVYVMHVPAQMKAFLDRSLGLGHRPRPTWKPGLAVSVSAGLGESAVGDYLAGVLRIFGAFSVGTLTAIAVAPGEFLGKEAVEARAQSLAMDLARAIKEERRYPATDRDLLFYQFMGDLVRKHKHFMKADYRHWQELGLFDGFEAYVQQDFSRTPYDPELRKAWIREMIAKQKRKSKPSDENRSRSGPYSGPHDAKSCRELLQMMPLGFKPDVARDLKAVYQFEIRNGEHFTAHLRIEDGRCTYHDGPAEKADVVIQTPADVWLAIARGELSGQTAYFHGGYKAEGKIGLLMELHRMF